MSAMRGIRGGALRRGSVMVSAMIALTLASTAMVAMGRLFTTQAERFRDGAAAAQLRVMVDAAAVQAPHLIADLGAGDSPRTIAVDLPAALAERGATLTLVVQPRDPRGVASVEVIAKLGEGRGVLQRTVRVAGRSSGGERDERGGAS